MLIVCDSSCVGLLIVQEILSRITAWSPDHRTPRCDSAQDFLYNQHRQYCSLEAITQQCGQFVTTKPIYYIYVQDTHTYTHTHTHTHTTPEYVLKCCVYGS